MPATPTGKRVPFPSAPLWLTTVNQAACYVRRSGFYPQWYILFQNQFGTWNIARYTVRLSTQKPTRACSSRGRTNSAGMFVMDVDIRGRR